MQGLMQQQPLVVNQILNYAARFHGKQEVISMTVEGPAKVYTYADMHRRSQQLALGLKALGIRAGDVVATMAWNGYRHMEAWYAIMGLGSVCHTLNPRLFKHQLVYIINHAEDSWLMLDTTFVPIIEALQEQCSRVKGFIIMTDRAHMPQQTTLRNVLCFEELLQAGPLPFRWEVTDENLACGLCYTSGTTGNPKGVLYSHRSNYLHALAAAQAAIMGLASSQTFLAIVPMFHANSWGLVFAAPLTGARLVLPGPQLDGKSVYTCLERFQVHGTAGVPTVFLGLLDHLRQHKLKLSSLQKVSVGGAACPPSVIRAFLEMGIQVNHSWGMTETSPICTAGELKSALGSLSLDDQVAVQSKQGWPHVLVDMRVVDDAGRELPMDGKAAGEVQVRGPHILHTYFKHDKRAVDDAGWFSTGDVGTLDEHGIMHITDRSKDVIKSGGEWISSIEIENLAVSHPQVAEAAVIAVPSKKWTERPLLICVPEQGEPPSKQAVLDFLKVTKQVQLRSVGLFEQQGKMARWWLPDSVMFVKEIPHTATGKISKLQLRQQFKHVTADGPSSKL